MRRYYVKCGQENIRRLSHLNIKNIKKSEGYFAFYADRKSIEQIKDFPNTEYYDRFRYAVKAIIKKHLIAIIGCLLIVIALVNQNISVAAVRFTDSDTYDEAVLEYLEKYYRRIGPFCYLNANLTDINYDLRSTFYHYEWIGVRKSGAVLYLDIKKLINPPRLEDPTPGALYAETEGIIKKYHVEKGTVVIHEEQYVRPGDLLISGEVVHYNNEIEPVRAKGYVIAEVLKYHDYTVPKTTTDLIRTGKLEIVKAYILCGRQINKTPSQFENYVVEAGAAKGGKLFQIKTFYRYELKEVTTVYTEEEAVEYSKSLVYKAFRADKTVDKERIVFIKHVRTEQDKDYYYIRLIVKSYQNIARFVPYQ
ncbi:MAG: sporulation protein YqfD [Bacilli bacterium]|nr:sporulation protein YqfD [Bacilli bacterium]